MQNEFTIPGIVVGLMITLWILGKAIRSIPVLYRDSRAKKGSEMYGDLTMLLGLRVLKILLAWGLFIWLSNKLDYELKWMEDVNFAVLVALFFAGFSSFFVLIGTFLLAKLTKVQHVVKESDVLDDERDFKL